LQAKLAPTPFQIKNSWIFDPLFLLFYFGAAAASIVGFKMFFFTLINPSLAAGQSPQRIEIKLKLAIQIV